MPVFSYTLDTLLTGKKKNFFFPLASQVQNQRSKIEWTEDRLTGVKMVVSYVYRTNKNEKKNPEEAIGPGGFYTIFTKDSRSMEK